MIPKTRTEWWLAKIKGNMLNDQKKQMTLLGMGWKVLHVWECKLKPGKVDKTLDKLLQISAKASSKKSFLLLSDIFYL